ncbi:MAG: hypothetical protein D6712_10430 [Chloroflexi bacterium]|nr:MAG: hypothetical protein D6712_10430 [Chloroflexota bacterium]
MVSTTKDKPALWGDELPQRFQLPKWAKQSNPIVRRHLGMYWKTVPPDVIPLVMAAAIQICLVLLAAWAPFIFDLWTPLVVASVLAMPLAYYAYMRVLLNVAIHAADVMSQELRNDTLNLLRTTPLDLRDIFLGKIAAAMWREMDLWSVLFGVAVFFSVPVIVMNYAVMWPPTEYPLLAHVAIIIGFVVALARMVLEPMMVGAVGVLIGSIVSYRSTAMSAAMGTGILYFVMLQLVRQIPVGDSFIGRMVLDMGVPLVLPIFIIWGALKLAAYVVTRD